VGRLGPGDVDAACVGFSAAPRVRRPSCPPPLVAAAVRAVRALTQARTSWAGRFPAAGRATDATGQ